MNEERLTQAITVVETLLEQMAQSNAIIRNRELTYEQQFVRLKELLELDDKHILKILDSGGFSDIQIRQYEWKTR